MVLSARIGPFDLQVACLPASVVGTVADSSRLTVS
jgi:hypothetical protein